ncbi:ATP-binding protein [Magnetospirillum sp. UT-4]|uniref:ATP-binding protein n=1 Tax=Magnetospirillum sp. UT-4 TaxID=2681467 RepID=UPI00137D4A9D|nr:ATP-binding protein [Magnetospirillum sp. UT-4]CAA7625339.1 putative signal transduction histidine kinase [Magnetospirillum sp. UT-4]
MTPRRLLPDSVLARTALVLVAAMVVSLGAALAMFASTRSEALQALGGRNAAERVAALVQLAEQTPPDSRRPTLRSMDQQGFRAGWGPDPVVDADETGHPAAMAAVRHLRSALDGREVLAGVGRGGPGMGLGHGPGPGHTMGPFLKVSVRLADGSWLNVVAPLVRVDSLWRARFVVPLLAALAAVTLAALWAVRRATRPFATFAAAAERLGVEITAPPLPESGPREVRRAAHAFNVMQGRIRRFVDDRTQMLAAISHDLRTPITRMRLRAEFVEDEGERAKMLADLEEMERMIAATLAFARDEAAREERRPLDLAALVQGLADDLGAAYSGPDSLVVEARPLALKRAIANLLDNARKYGGTARVTVADDGRHWTVTVEDDGPGIPEAEFERVFAPFVRLEASRNRDTGGSGLGLAIARAAARAHGGDITLANRPEGGLRAILVLPRA